MIHSTLSGELLREHLLDPMGYDAKVRCLCRIPEDRYYTVSVWPEHLAGRVFLTPNLTRVVKAPKISKSSQ